MIDFGLNVFPDKKVWIFGVLQVWVCAARVFVAPKGGTECSEGSWERWNMFLEEVDRVWDNPVAVRAHTHDAGGARGPKTVATEP